MSGLHTVTKDWLTPHEVGTLAGGFSANFIRREILAGELTADYCLPSRGKLGRWRIRREHAEAYAEKLRRAHPQSSQSSNTTPS
jgi:hypothetical protein